MLKKAFRDILIVFGLVVLWASTSRTAMQYLFEKRDHNKWWGDYQGLKGDLVSMSYLDIVSKFVQPAPRGGFKHPPFNGKKNIVLYMDGDSYTWHLHDSDFAGLDSFCYFQRNHGIKYHLDTTKKNILVIEVSERYMQSYFSGLNMFNEVIDTTAIKKTVTWQYKHTAAGTRCASVVPFSIDDLFNKYINQNLQFNLFNYNFIMPMFESKAALNYYIFNRASGDVVISDDRNFLFFKETVSKTDVGSSYYPVSQADASHIVDILNSIYDHYKAAGFAEVYFSVIPNSATIMQPAGYNNLIPMVQNDAHLKMKILDIYTVFKQSNDIYYLPGDTHWNHKGKQLWLDMVNEQVLKQ